ncbi:hypothetical protein KIPB_012812, partial [Kipferlia bialata]
ILFNTFADNTQNISYLRYIDLVTTLAFAQTMFSWSDKDRDGKITYDEFIGILAFMK